MIKLPLLFTVICFFGLFSMQAQTTYNPIIENTHVFWGQGFESNSFSRLPADAQQTIPADVWNQSLRPSGMQIRFRSNATDITVKYSLIALSTGNKWYSEMGANGVDLLAGKNDGSWHWCFPAKKEAGNFFEYSKLIYDNVDKSYEYVLYLPTFAVPASLTITVNDGAEFKFIPVNHEKKPIVIYGTSIVHGAVSSRSGNIWTNIVSRNFYDTPVVNLGFSGVGRVEPEVIEVINRIDAALLIIDCLPNMTNEKMLPHIESRYTLAIEAIRKLRPDMPILLTEHPGYTHMQTHELRKQWVTDANQQLKKVYKAFINKGYKQLYYLSREELGLDLTADFGDYIHPNDKGMYRYADVYTTKIAKILKTKSCR
jgi:hypothetical protein